MMKHTLLALAATLPALAQADMPPVIASGPIHYDDITYQESAVPIAPAPATPAYTSPADYTAAPITPAPSQGSNGEIIFNAYSSNYQVRGMGVTNELSNYGYSSVSGSYTLPNRNLFNRGIYQRVSGTYGQIWGAADALGDTPLFNLNYALGKELLPNLTLELGYSLHRGGLEGFMARATGAPHRFTQDLNLALCFDDHQRGLFGHVAWGVGFQGLTGSYLDLELGYRLTDIASRGNFGADLELSAGMAPSFGYWGGGVEGIDAYRLRAALRPFSHSGTFGRDARLQLTPWIQCSWTGHNAAKIDRRVHCGPADHFQFTVGFDAGWKF